MFFFILKCDDDKIYKDVYYEESYDDDKDKVENSYNWLVVMNRFIIFFIGINGFI